MDLRHQQFSSICAKDPYVKTVHALKYTVRGINRQGSKGESVTK